MVGKETGKETRRLVTELQDLLLSSGWEIFFDPHRKEAKDQSACHPSHPTPYFKIDGKKYTLSHVDIAIVDKKSGTVKVLCEIEESGAEPKKVIGDVVNIMLSKNVRIQKKDYKYDDPYLILGLIVEKGGKSREKAEKLEEQIKGAVKAGPFLNKDRIKIIPRSDAEKLIKVVKNEICQILGIKSIEEQML